MRVPRWDNQLVAFTEDVRGADYIWGETDCASLVIRSINGIHDEERFEFLPDWNTEIGAKRAISKIDSVDVALMKAGGEKQSPNFKQSGDVVAGMDNNEGFPGLGVVVREMILTSSPDKGVYVVGYHTESPNKLYRL